MLIFHLKKKWYDKIKSGEKTVEYREVNPYWEKRLWENCCDAVPYNYQEFKDFLPPIYCYFQLGYKPETRIKAHIKKVEIVDGKNTDLKIDKPMYAIHFELEGVKNEYKVLY